MSTVEPIRGARAPVLDLRDAEVAEQLEDDERPKSAARSSGVAELLACHPEPRSRRGDSPESVKGTSQLKSARHRGEEAPVAIARSLAAPRQLGMTIRSVPSNCSHCGKSGRVAGAFSSRFAIPPPRRTVRASFLSENRRYVRCPGAPTSNGPWGRIKRRSVPGH